MVKDLEHCDYCGFSSKNIESIISHEKRCPLRPSNAPSRIGEQMEERGVMPIFFICKSRNRRGLLLLAKPLQEGGGVIGYFHVSSIADLVEGRKNSVAVLPFKSKEP